MTLVTVRSFETHWQAAFAQNRLEEEGIQSFLQGQETQVIEGPFNNIVGGVRLQVRQEDSSRAHALLEGIQFSASSPEDDKGDSLPCLSCGQPIPEEGNQCPACGWTYRSGGDQAEPGSGA